MNIKNIELHDLCVFLREERVLIISDLHLGYEESLTSKGVLVPHSQFAHTEHRMLATVRALKPKTIVFNGDFKHDFGKIASSEWREGRKLLETVRKHTKSILIIEGNHDPSIGPFAAKIQVQIASLLISNDTLIVHGDEIPQESSLNNIKTIIIGHEHPAVTIREGMVSETYKCFLVGAWKRKRLIVMPSYNLITQGTNVLTQTLLSPFLSSIDSFRVIVSQNGLFDFGKIKDMKKL